MRTRLHCSAPQIFVRSFGRGDAFRTPAVARLCPGKTEAPVERDADTFRVWNRAAPEGFGLDLHPTSMRTASWQPIGRDQVAAVLTRSNTGSRTHFRQSNS